MPFTFFAHQAPVLPLKIVRPRWFDGTALCIGSMAPDFAYPIGGWVRDQGHTAIGVVVWSLPLTLVICWAIRSWVATTAFAQLPDLWWLRLHSYRALALRRPVWWLTLSSALLGATTHVVLDAFTHSDRWGAEAVGWDRPLARFDDTPLADVLQNVGHTLGSAIGLALLAYIGHRRLMERWYGADAVARVRRFTLAAHQRLLFWAVAGSGVPIGIGWVLLTHGYAIHKVIDAVAVTTALACALPAAKPEAT
jgi:hypothetical protein